MIAPEILKNPDLSLIILDRIECAESFATFVQRAWHVLEPETRYVHNWHIDAICEHLEAITDGHINRLLINISPGCSKSLLTSVLWNAWEWGPRNRAGLRYLATAFKEDAATRDNGKVRHLIESDWYQARWPHVQLVKRDERKITNTLMGVREVSAFNSLTSKRGDRLIIDDPHSTEQAESEAERARTTRKFREGAVNRLNDQEKSAMVVIMQRLHQSDVSGLILDEQRNFEHLLIPMEFEPNRRVHTSIGWTDPREKEGEVMDPIRFPPTAIEELKKSGAYFWNGQYQQRPAAREGAMFKHHWFDRQIIGLDEVPPIVTWCRGWDFAGSTEKTADATSGVKIGKSADGRFFVFDVRHFRYESPEVKRRVRATAEADGPKVVVDIPQDAGSAGKALRIEYVAHLAGFTVKWGPETGSKENRAEPFQTQCENKNVWLVRGDWNQPYIDELCSFPVGKHDDMVDATSRAFNRIVGRVEKKPSIVAPRLLEAN